MQQYPWSLLIVIIILYIQMIVSLDSQLWWKICLGPYSRGLSFKDEYSKGAKTSTILLRSWIKHAALLLAKTQWIFMCVFHCYDFSFFTSSLLAWTSKVSWLLSSVGYCSCSIDLQENLWFLKSCYYLEKKDGVHKVINLVYLPRKFYSQRKHLCM